MKVYVVTAGCYSDYHIERIFTDKDKAEEYCKWCYDSNDIEEYDIDDNIELDKYYRIDTRYENSPEQKPTIEIQRVMEKQIYPAYTSCVQYRQSIRLQIIRFIPEKAFDEELVTQKYTKVAYDTMAFIKQMLNEGYTKEQVNEMLNSQSYKKENIENV